MVFTGIIQEVGKIQNIVRQEKDFQITISCLQEWLDHSKLGDSIAVNGVCLTITELTSNTFSADLAPSTLQKTALQNLKMEDPVNLEKAMTLESFLGGHIVQGHVNATATVESIMPMDNCFLLSIQLPEELLKYCIQEGSITIDGVSLTISNIVQHNIHINIIPHTWDKTIISKYQAGRLVNIEVDIIAKYMEKWLSPWMKNFKRT